MSTQRRRRITVVALLVALAVTTLVIAVTVRLPGDDAPRTDDVTGPPSQGQDRALAPRTSPGRGPNIVMIMVDDMRDDDLRYMPRTRRLLGGYGVRFVNSFSPFPLCCPARASVLSGLYTHNHGVDGIFLPDGFTAFDDRSTLATWLHDAGYATDYVGKYLNGYGWMPEPGARSGSSLRYVPPGWDGWYASIFEPPSSSRLPAGAHKDHYDLFDTTITTKSGGLRRIVGRYQTDVFGRLSRQIIRRRAVADRPYFHYVSYSAPHYAMPVEPDDPPRSIRRHDGGRTHVLTPARPQWVRGRFDDVITTTPGDTWRDPDITDKPGYLRARPPLARRERVALLELARQRAEALWVLDREVARTIRTVAATSEMPNTVIMLTSDNGYFLGEQRMRSGKIYPHDPSLRVPFLIRGPGIPLGGRRTDPVTSIDVAPTLARLAGVEPPQGLDGVSLARVARDGDRGWARGIVTETGRTNLPGHPRHLLGLRTARYLYVEVAYGGRELYDVVRDPDQYHNLATRPAYDGVQRQLAQVLHRLQDCQGEECARPLPRRFRTP